MKGPSALPAIVPPKPRTATPPPSATDVIGFVIENSRTMVSSPHATPASTSLLAAIPAATGGHYVQVGVFADPANAARAIARLKSMGLTVSSATGQKGGHPVKAVMAGPFASAAEQQAALAALRRAGYGDAYAR